MATTRQKDLVFLLALGKTSEEEFLRQFPASSKIVASLGSHMLLDALSERDADAVEAGIILGERFGMDENYAGLLERLAGEDWHRKHEDVVLVLGEIKSQASIDAICATANSQHPYLMSYDGSFGLRSKAIHALANIGTLEAVRKLEALFEAFQEPKLRAKVIRRWRDLALGGTSEQVRAESRAALSRFGAGFEDA